MTKSQVNKLGKLIKKELENDSIPDADILDKLQEYRTTFKDDLASIFKTISEIAKNARKDSITSFRIKRIESILSKIKREPTMALGNMGDIAGCRILVYNEDTLPKVINDLHSNFDVKYFNDYLRESKEDGYSGYHLYIISPIDPSKLIEIQVRTVNAHKWASMVEIIDILYNLKIKEGQKNEEFEKFLLLLSRKETLTIDEKKQLIKIDRNKDIHGRLNQVFIKNNIQLRKEWLDITRLQNNNYFIIEVNSNKESNIISYSSYENAEKEYFEKFKTNKNSHFVLTHIEKPNFNRICIAYASYVLIKHDYLNDWNHITSDLIDYSLKKKNIKDLEFYRAYTMDNLAEQLKLTQSELKQFRTYEEDGHLDTENFDEWLEEIESRLKELAKIAIVYSKNEDRKNKWKELLGL